MGQAVRLQGEHSAGFPEIGVLGRALEMKYVINQCTTSLPQRVWHAPFAILEAKSAGNIAQQ